MSANTQFQILRIIVAPSPESGDHQVRFLIDGQDVLARYWIDMIGMDPSEILIEPCPLVAGAVATAATIARCICGIAGCDSRSVDITEDGEAVIWHILRPSKGRFAFERAAYRREIERALRDTSWETPDRTAARLIAAALPRDVLAAHGFAFDWAWGRAEDGEFTISLRLEPGPYQILVRLPWNGEEPPALAEKAARLLAHDPRTWRGVEWNLQCPNPSPGAPALAGPGWSQWLPPRQGDS